MEDRYKPNVINCTPQTNENNMKKSSSHETLEKLTEDAFKILAEATKSSNKLPFGKSRDLYESCPSFHNIMTIQENQILTNLSNVLKHVNWKGNIFKRDDDDKFEMIVDVNDSILEKVGISLDRIDRISYKYPEQNLPLHKTEPISCSWNDSRLSSVGATQVLNNILNKTKNMDKPQLKFDDKINNDATIPFEPRIKYKYNMLRPLAILPETTENGVCVYANPYEFEISKFKPLKEQLEFCPPTPYKSLEETPLNFVVTPEDVTAMVEDLQKSREIAVDLEHHSYRSFQGFTCLMQISTRNVDYIIDTLKLRSNLQELNKIFTNPSIVKVFHGADLDILWLQKDLSLYVVNMFDTHQAVKLLNYPKLSLAYLLMHFCNIEAQKHFQLADWRIRPLPQELITYARDDTHYLLYIYDSLKNILIEKGNGKTNLLESIISESSRICLKTYSKPQFDNDEHLDIYHRSKKLFNNRQKFALQKLFEWRDKIARELDESLAYVLPNHMMLNISEVLPREAQGILACCNPIPVPVRQNLLALHQIILKAREQPLIQPILEEQRFYRPTAAINSFENPLLCPHDLNQDGEFRDDLPVLIKNYSQMDLDPTPNVPADLDVKLEKTNKQTIPIVNIFENLIHPSGQDKLLQFIKKAVNLSPYHRYKLAKKFAESVEAQNLLKLKKYKTEKPIEKEEFTDHNPAILNIASQKIEVEKPEQNTQMTVIPDNVSKTNICSESTDLTNVGSNKKRTLRGDEMKVNKRLKGSKRKHDEKIKNREKEFVPYNYDAVNFEQYKTFTTPAIKKTHKTIKNRYKKSKKKFKISI